MGVVYRAEHVYIGREVAVKILHEGYGGREESIKRFLREARAASLINHPNIVEVTDFGKASDGTVFFVMELLVGDPLDNILANERRLDLLRSITICNQLAAALAAAHSKGIIHRDLKPENVMLIPREGRRELVRRVADESGAYELSEREKQFDFVKILDFGVAKVREPENHKPRTTQAGVVFGTPEYMAPETARIGFSDARSDIYALGIMFYEMMTGTVPFTGEAPVEVMMKQVNERVPPMRKVCPDAEINEDAERMILKALAKDPEQRHQSMEEFHRDLQKCYGQLRFRRIVKTPTVSIPAVPTIQLTRKKKTQVVPGPVPTNIASGGSVTEEIDPDAGRLRSMTPKLPGLPLNTRAPILLTKKKTPRLDDRTDDGKRIPAPTTDRGPDTVATPVSQPVVPRIPELVAQRVPEAAAQELTPTPIPKRTPNATPNATPKKKRTTLPLGLEQPAERAFATPPGTMGAAPRTPPLPSRGTDGGRLMNAVPPRPDFARGVPFPSDRATPRVTVASGDASDRNWLDEPTSSPQATGATSTAGLKRGG